MKNIINCSCARYSDISTITHSAKYRHRKNIKISFFQYRTSVFICTHFVRDRRMDEARTQMQEVKRVLLITMINKTNKNYPVGEKQTGWTGQDKAGQDTDDIII